MTLNLSKIFDFIFPPSEDELLIRNTEELPLQLKNVDGILSLSEYSNKPVRAAIHLVKYHNHPKARALLSKLLKDYLSTLDDKEKVIIPIPLSQKRLRDRGYNQIEVVVKEAVKGLDNCRVKSNLLWRSKHTQPQTSLSKTDRLSNVKNAFAVKTSPAKNVQLSNCHVILIDDVTTTGATLKAAKAALLPLQPASITCLALAH